MEQKSTAVKTLTNGIAHLFKQNKVLYWLWLPINFISEVFFRVGMRFCANYSYLQNEPAFYIWIIFCFPCRLHELMDMAQFLDQMKCVKFFFFCNQSCVVVERSGSWCLTFALGWLENLSFFIQMMCWAPWILQVQCIGLLSIFWALSLANANLNWVFFLKVCKSWNWFEHCQRKLCCNVNLMIFFIIFIVGPG